MTRQQLEDLFWRATVICLGLDPDSEDEAVQKRVRISWPTVDAEDGIVTTDWKRDENVVFLRISPGYDTYGTLHDVDHVYDAQTDTQKEVVRYHRSHRILWVCYGPYADNDADTLRIGMFRDSIRAYLNEHNVAIMPHLRDPVRMPEKDDSGDWWERCDLEADFYQLVSREYSEDVIDQLPDINIQLRR